MRKAKKNLAQRQRKVDGDLREKMMTGRSEGGYLSHQSAPTADRGIGNDYD